MSNEPITPAGREVELEVLDREGHLMITIPVTEDEVERMKENYRDSERQSGRKDFEDAGTGA